MRVVVRNGEVVADATATLPGRGAWVHPAVECVEMALKRRAFGRAFKARGSLDAAAVLTFVADRPDNQLTEQAEWHMDKQ